MKDLGVLEDYIASHSDSEPEGLAALRRKANIRLVNGRMVSGHTQGRLLKMMVALSGAARVLELGTFAGYSALCLAEGLPEGGEVHTLEADDELEDFIRSEALSLPYGDRIRLHIGDACRLMQEMADSEGFKPFDLIFIDADKRQYCSYYELAKRLLRPGGLILADNTLWDGHVTDPAYDRDRQTRAIREFNDLVAADCETDKVMLPLRDGLTLIRKH